MKKNLTLFLALSISIFSINAQLGYTMSNSNTTYSNLIAPTITHGVWAQEEFRIPLPFNFKYFDSIYKSINIAYQNMFFTTNPLNSDNIFFISQDLIPENDDTLLSPISYQTSGTSPNRIFKIEYKNMHAVLQDTSEKFVANYQVWFYETSNKFEFRFGPNEVTDLNFTEFIMGFIDFDNTPYLGVSGTAANPTLVRVVSALTFKGISSHPLSGQVYTFTPDAPPTSISNIAKPYLFSISDEGFHFKSSEKTALSIYDLNGKLIESIQYEEGQSLTYKFTNCPSGLYFVNINSGISFNTEKTLIFK